MTAICEYWSETEKLEVWKNSMPPGISETKAFLSAPCAFCAEFCSTIDMPMAEISGASRNEPRSGR